MSTATFDTNINQPAPHLNFINPPGIPVDTGAQTIKWLADTWETELTPPNQWQQLHDRHNETPHIFHKLEDTARGANTDHLVHQLTHTPTTNWEEVLGAHVNQGALATYLESTGGISRLEQRTQESIRKAAQTVANNRSTRLHIAAQLDTTTVTKKFTRAAKILGDMAWSQDHRALAAQGRTYTDFITAGAKLQALAYYLNMPQQDADQRIPNICVMTNVKAMKPLKIISNGIMQGIVSTPWEQEAHSRAKKIETEARNHFCDFITKLAQEKYENLVLDVATAPDTLDARQTALTTWGKSETTYDENAIVPLSRGNHQRI